MFLAIAKGLRYTPADGDRWDGMIDIGTVWDRTTRFLGNHMAAVMPIAIAALFVPLCIWTSVAPVAAKATGAERTVIYAARLIFALWMMWGKLAITALAVSPGDARGATTTATRRLVPAVIVSLVLLLACLVLALPVVVALAAGGFDFSAAMAGRKPDMPGGGALALVLLYVPVIGVLLLVVAPRLAFITPAVVAERLSLGAIRRSVRLTRGLWLKLIGLLLLYLVVVQVSTLATQFVFGSLLRLAFGDAGTVSLASVLTAILVAAVATVFSVLAVAFTAKLYLAAREVREGAAAPL